MVIRTVVLSLASCLMVATPFVSLASAEKAIPQEVREEGRRACEADVHRLCDEYIPNEQEIEVCLKKQMRSLSPACRKIMH